MISNRSRETVWPEALLWERVPIMNVLYLFMAACPMMIGLLYAEWTKKGRMALLCKASMSILFIVVAIVLPHYIRSYFYCVLGGLVFGLIGDVCLALPGDRYFRLGMLSHLACRVLYTIAFASLSELGGWFQPEHLVVIALSVLIFFWLHSRLENIRFPVLVYLVVSSVMVISASAAFENMFLPRYGVGAILVGAIVLYLSDVFVARHRFVRTQHINLFFSHQLYYLAQFIVACSTGLVD